MWCFTKYGKCNIWGVHFTSFRMPYDAYEIFEFWFIHQFNPVVDCYESLWPKLWMILRVQYMWYFYERLNESCKAPQFSGCWNVTSRGRKEIILTKLCSHCIRQLKQIMLLLICMDCCRKSDDLNTRLYCDFSIILIYFCWIYDDSLHMTSWNSSTNKVNTFVMTGIRPCQPKVLPIFTYTPGGETRGEKGNVVAQGCATYPLYYLTHLWFHTPVWVPFRHSILHIWTNITFYRTGMMLHIYGRRYNDT